MRCALVMMLSLLALSAQAQEDEARKQFQAGKEFYVHGRYEEALHAFNSAGKIRPSPLLDYNIARCHEKLGNRKEAVDAYERYLTGKPDAPNREEVRERIASLKKALAPPPPPPPTSRPVPPVDPTPPAESKLGSGGERRDDPMHEAMIQPKSEAQKSPPPPKKDRPPKPAKPPKEGPFYKQWWFWVACAGAAVIVGFVVATAVSKPDSGPSTQQKGLRFSF